MADTKHKVTVPDLGGASDVDVIDVMVSEGDVVAVEDALMTVEGDKATMDIPAPIAGVVRAVHIAVGEKVSEGSLILEIEGGEETTTESSTQEPAGDAGEESTGSSPEAVQQVVVPDLSGASQVDLIEIVVSVGDQVAVEDALITLEGDKATMDVPTPIAGTIQALHMSVGDKVSEGDLIADIVVSGDMSAVASTPQKTKAKAPAAPKQGGFSFSKRGTCCSG